MTDVFQVPGAHSAGVQGGVPFVLRRIGDLEGKARTLQKLAELVLCGGAHKHCLSLLCTQEMGEALEALADAGAEMACCGRQCAQPLALDDGGADALCGRVHLRMVHFMRPAREGTKQHVLKGQEIHTQLVLRPHRRLRTCPLLVHEPLT